MDLNSKEFKIEAVQEALIALERRKDGYDDVNERKKERIYGLCHIFNLRHSAHQAQISFFVKAYAENRKVFYDCKGEKSTFSSQFVWLPWSYEVRVKWLNKLLTELQK